MPIELRSGLPVRVVIDTNTALSGLIWNGPPSQIINAAQEEQIALFTSDVLLNELGGVLRRAKFARVLAQSNLTPDQLIEEYQKLVTRIDAPPLAEPAARDPDDDAVLACALAAQAEAIISGDADLLVLGNYQEIPILTAPELLARLSSPAAPNVEG